jgi:hypothetical protein
MGHHLRRLDGLVVAVGQFNPAIVTPEWLLAKGLIDESDKDAALSTMQALVREGLMAFDATWFSLRLVQNQMVLSTTAGLTPRIRDLAVGIFALLPETPLTGLGLNFAADVQFDSADEYHRFGYTLAPRAIWKELYPDLHSGLASLTIAIDQQLRQGDLAPVPGRGQRRFTIQPSNTISPNAVHIAFNHHSPLEPKNGARDALRIIAESWDDVQREAEMAILTVAEKASKGVGS